MCRCVTSASIEVKLTFAGCGMLMLLLTGY